MRLAGAGRAVEQDAALEVLALLAQPVAVLGEPDDVGAHLLQRAVRQHHLVGGQVGPAVEGEAGHRPLVGIAAEADHLAPEHAATHGRLADLGQQGGGRLRPRSEHLEARLRAVLRVADPLQHDDRASRRGGRRAGRRQRWPARCRARGHVEAVDLAAAETSPLGAGDIRSPSELWCRWSPPPTPSSLASGSRPAIVARAMSVSAHRWTSIFSTTTGTSSAAVPRCASRIAIRSSPRRSTGSSSRTSCLTSRAQGGPQLVVALLVLAVPRGHGREPSRWSWRRLVGQLG